MKRVRTKSSDNYTSEAKKNKDSPKRKNSVISVTTNDLSSPTLERVLSPLDTNVSKPNNKSKFNLKIVSHGRIHGPLPEPDEEKEEMLNFSVRDVANPPAKLRKNHTGLSPRLRKEIFSDKNARLKYDTMVIEIEKMMKAMEIGANWDADHPGAVDDQAPTMLIVGIQCEEGRHRGVGYAEELGGSITRNDWSVVVEHRDLAANEADGGMESDDDEPETPTMGKKMGIKSLRKKDKNLKKARDKRLIVEVVGSGAEDGFA